VNNDAIAQALAQTQNQQASAPQNPYVLNTALEQQVAPNNIPVNPLIMAIAKRFGLLSLIRNNQNEKMATLDYQ
jgi:hypothetical protein